MAVVFNRTAHMTMWLMIADRARVRGCISSRISRVKNEILFAMRSNEMKRPEAACFACEAAKNPVTGKASCEYCPLEDFNCYPGLYEDAMVLCEEFGGNNIHKRPVKLFYEICIEIAMWPVKKDVICR